MTRKAKARMLWGQISISPRVNSLSLKACLLYTWIIPHADDFGRMSSNPREIKAIACPLRSDIQEVDIHSLLTEMIDQKLIDIYEARGQSVLQLVDWTEYQNLRQPRPSVYPDKLLGIKEVESKDEPDVELERT